MSEEIGTSPERSSKESIVGSASQLHMPFWTRLTVEPPAPIGLESGMRRAALYCAIAVMVFSLLTLGDWAFHRIAGLRLSSQIPPHALVSLALLLTGVSVVLTLAERAPRHSTQLCRCIGALLLCAGVLLLVILPHVTQNRELPPEERTGPGADAGLSWESPTRYEVIGIALLGGAILALASRRERVRWIGQTLAVCVFAVALLAIVGYLFRAPELYVAGDSFWTGILEAALFGVAALALLLSRPAEALMRAVSSEGPGGQSARRMIPACLVLPVVCGLALFLAAESNMLARTTSLALSVLATILFLLGLIWVNATLIDRADARRHQATQALRRSELFYHTLVETLPQNILRKDAEGRFTFCNDRFCQTVGRERSMMIGKTDFDLFPQALAQKYRGDDIRVMNEMKTMEMVESHITPDGREHFVHVIKTPLLDGKMNPIGVQGIFWDVTSERLRERRLRDQNEQLQQMAESERKAHEELKRAQAQMVQTAKLVGLGQTVAGVAHEINNPLAYVINNLVVLDRDISSIRDVLARYREADPLLEAQAAKLCEEIRRLWEEADIDYTLANLTGLFERTRDGLGRIQRIVKDLRVFARVDEDRYNDADLNEGVVSTVHIVQGNAKARGVTIALELGEIPLLFCQSAKINQVILNLVSNAIEASSSGGQVTVRTFVDGDLIALDVHDRGCGIDPAIKDRIFDPFFTTKPIGEGTGLGLSISYGIVTDHDGTIDAESMPETGTTFAVRLPMRKEATRSAESRRSHPEPKEEPAAELAASTTGEGSR